MLASTDIINKAFQFRMLGVYTERLADIVLTPGEETSRSSRDGSSNANADSYYTAGDGVMPATAIDPARLPLEIAGVRFGYGVDSPDILRQAALQLETGEVVALVGGSGSGKTTLLKLVLGIYRPSAGSIRVFGVDTTEPRFVPLRRKIGTVLQDDCVFSGSILDNITMFAHDPDPERAAQCAQLAEIHQDILAMSMGYHTRVSEMGATLSGGQRQRILLARALYKQPCLLILDEATSHLDVHNETRIAATLRQLGLPILLIAHRPDTVAAADRVLELVNGEIVAVAAPVPKRGRVAAE